MGIDYGIGQTNIDTANGIRYGVIPSNDLSPDAFHDIEINGDDVDFEEYRAQVQASISSALSAVLDANGLDHGNDADELAEGVVDALEWDSYEGTGDCTRYHYSDDEVTLETCSDGDVFITKSLYYTLAPYCSPCAPGACYLRDGSKDGQARAYCLPSDWFDDESPCPYPYWTVDGDRLVYEPA